LAGIPTWAKRSETLLGGWVVNSSRALVARRYSYSKKKKKKKKKEK
jgi:hypothetical protein